MSNSAFSRALWIGVAMLGLGFEVWFINDFTLPLAFVWIAGPLLSYGGFTVVCFVLGNKLFFSVKAPQGPLVKTADGSVPGYAAKAVTIAFFIMLGILAPSKVFAADAAANFKAKCAMCHGPTGDGKTPMGSKLNIPDLKSKPVQSESDAQLASAISKGKGKMPAFAGKLTAAEMTAMVAYVRQMLGQ